MISTQRCLAFASALWIAAAPVAAQQVTKAAPGDTAAKLGSVKVVADREVRPRLTPLQTATLPVSASVTAKRAEETVNLVDAEDAVKYLPSVFLRKRNNGDTQAVMGTRVWGVSSSARSLVFADGVPLSALIANNNNIGGPRWGLVAPTEIERIDMMYGPFSAAYSGNSMGAVLEITTRLPQKLEGSVSQTHTVQAFDLYGTKKNFATMQTSASVGDRFGKFAVWLSGNYQDSHAQPLTYVTAGAFPTGTTGGYTETNKLGAAANVLGASGLLNTGMTNAKLKAAYNITPTVRAAYTYGVWKNDANSGVEPYIQKAGTATFASQAGFATGNYDLIQTHSSHNLSIRTDTKGDWDWEAVGTTYRFDKDQQRSPTTAAATGLTFGTAGRAAVLDGTSWATLDFKATWHNGGEAATHTVSFGVHQDEYTLANPTYNTSEWTTGGLGTVASEGDGKTRTQAVWAQDAWRVAPGVKITVGGRYERWRAYDGFNANGTTKVTQRETSASKFSPKAVLAWEATPDFTIAASTAKAYRFATASELFQLVTTGATFSSPNPNLKPDDVLATELRFDRRFERARVQLALFQDDVHDAMISQFLPLVAGSTTLFSYVSNVDHVRARGAELIWSERSIGMRNLELSGSITYLDARILALDGRASATAAAGSAIGKFLPNIPAWRGNLLATFRANEKLSFSAAGRYSGKLYTTLDNADVHPNTYQGFTEWFVADAKANYRFSTHVSGSLGVDNLFNRKYFLFHPFPQRTFVGNLKYDY
jgi:iron complex outermembrane receptor protein